MFFLVLRVPCGVVISSVGVTCPRLHGLLCVVDLRVTLTTSRDVVILCFLVSLVEQETTTVCGSET